MKVAFALLALVALAYSAPQARNSFYEHYEDFIDLIMDESGHDIYHLMEHYLEFKEFQAAIDYMDSNDLEDLVEEMEDLPEFKAVVKFLDGHGIDIMYFVEAIDLAFDFIGKKHARHELSGRDYSAFIRDCISKFPKDKLSALYEQKIAEHEDFANAMAALESEEWHEIYGALINSRTFQKEAANLMEHGIDFHDLIYEITAVFGKF